MTPVQSIMKTCLDSSCLAAKGILLCSCLIGCASLSPHVHPPPGRTCCAVPVAQRPSSSVAVSCSPRSRASLRVSLLHSILSTDCGWSTTTLPGGCLDVGLRHEVPSQAVLDTQYAILDHWRGAAEQELGVQPASGAVAPKISNRRRSPPSSTEL